MIERWIFTALTEGLAELAAHPTRLERIFGFYLGVDDAEVAKIRTYFLAHVPEVIHNYAREDRTFPVYAIVLREEEEATKFLGDFGGLVQAAEEADFSGYADDEVLEGAEIFASIYRHTYDILVYAKHPDVCVWYYHLAKYLMTRARDFFVDCGLFDMALSGADLAPDAAYLPSYLFARTLTFSCQRELQVLGDRQTQAFKVAGMHLGGGSESDMGGVKTLVTAGETE